MMICVSALLSFGWVENAEAYESGTVTDGAIVRGKVTFKGSVPEPKNSNYTATRTVHFAGSCQMETDIAF